MRQRLVEDQEGECKALECKALLSRVTALEAEAVLRDAEVCAPLSYYSYVYAPLSYYSYVSAPFRC